MRTNLLNFFSIKNLNMTADIIWNLISTVIIGLGGLFLSFSIALYYGTEQLGIFHQIFTFYLILSLFYRFCSILLICIGCLILQTFHYFYWILLNFINLFIDFQWILLMFIELLKILRKIKPKVYRFLFDFIEML